MHIYNEPLFIFVHRPFPSRRPPTYQHVGQVFDENDRERKTDIEGYTRGVPIPVSCRKNVDWIYG